VEVEVEDGDHGHFDKDVRRPQVCDDPVGGRMSLVGHSWPNRLEHQCQQNHPLELVAKPLSGHETSVDQARENLRIEVGRLVVPAADSNENKDVSVRQ
jgi:hypothetical protein